MILNPIGGQAMVREQRKEDESGSKLLEMKERLEKEGFKISGKVPFFEWLRPRPSEPKGAGDQIGDMLYILDPPVPKITPFDIAAVGIRIDDQIYFCLSFYYHKILEDVTDAEVIDRIYDQHASSWGPDLAAYFSEIASQFSLQWDCEYDDFIEDSLYGTFPIHSADLVLALVRAVMAKGLHKAQ
jgi:hypothetical protein